MTLMTCLWARGKMVVAFLVLGPLAVEGVGASGSAALRAMMVRRLLAALLCKPNGVVSIDDLLGALWGEHAPVTARKTLQVYVRRLRTALGDERRITHESGGYRIDVSPDELDATRFAQLVAQSATAKPEQAVNLLKRALELWRGLAYEDVREHAPVTDESRRLDEERWRVESRLAQLQLELGRHAELVPHLTKLVEVNPYREDFRGHLMLAMYRCGRQAEALDLYRSTRKLLDEELGVSPGPELQRLHEAILKADASLDLPQRRAVTVPRELPADVGGFVGRVQQVRALDEMLPDSSPVVISAIDGSAGVGKTALAVHWAHLAADRFPDGQLFVNLRGFDPADQPVSPAEALRRLLDALEVPPQRIPASTEAQAALYRSLLADRRMLIVLDNAYDAEQVRPLLPGSPTCLVVLTSRNRLTSLIATSNARPLMLDVLAPAEARHLLAARIGEARIAAELDAVAEIVARCVGLPLALAVVAARAITHPALSLAVLAAELADARGGLDAFDSDDPMTDLRAVFSWSYRRLSTAAARLFRLLGLHPGPDISVVAAASLCGLGVRQVEPLLAELNSAHLINEHASGRYTFHDLLRGYAGEQAQARDTVADRHGAIGRMLDHYVQTAYAADRLLDPARDPIVLVTALPGVNPESVPDYEAAMAWCTAEHQVLQATTSHAAHAGFDTHRWQLAWALTTFFDRQGHWDSLITAHRVAVDAAQRLADRGMQAYARRGLGRVYGRMGRYDDACVQYRYAIDLYGEAGDQSGQAHSHMGLGWALHRQGRNGEALENLRRAHSLFKAAGNRVGLANALNGMGWYHSLLGNHHQALAACEQALAQLQELGDLSGQADTWDTIGHAHHHLGNYRHAISCYEYAIGLYREQGQRYYETLTLTHLGETYDAADEHDEARASWQQALTILTELDHPDAEQVRIKLNE